MKDILHDNSFCQAYVRMEGSVGWSGKCTGKVIGDCLDFHTEIFTGKDAKQKAVAAVVGFLNSQGITPNKLRPGSLLTEFDYELAEIKMPRPWFTGELHHFTIEHGLSVIPNHGGFKIPPFQRTLIWSLEQRIKFIESIWYEFPIGEYTYNEIERDTDIEFLLLDGQQRWNAIYNYVESGFSVLGYPWNALGKLDKRRFKSKVFNARRTHYKDPEKMRDIFERLAFGGTVNVRGQEAGKTVSLLPSKALMGEL